MTGPARPQYRCADNRRREVVRAAGTLNGIDYVEVDPGQHLLRVHFLQPLPGTGAASVPAGPALTVDDIRISGGSSRRPVRVLAVTAAARVLTVTVDRPGDFSLHELQLAVPDAAGDVPAGFDTRLASVVFSFQAACPTGVDCLDEPACPPERLPEPALDYLAKDYDSFRRLMLDRLAVTMPDWHERNPADLQIALVELLAYVADRLSYLQDAVATEAYLGTARTRTSVRRHARLLDYTMSEGCSARTVLHFHATTGLRVPAGTAGRAGSGQDAPVFETLHEVDVRAAHNTIALHTWSDEQCCLPVGATRATLAGAGLALRAGDLLLLEETADPTGGAADPTHRQVVRLTVATPAVDRLDGTSLMEVRWARPDALTFPLCVSVPGATTATARGNLALADHGGSRTASGLVAEQQPPPGRWRPLVPETPLARSVPHDAAAPAVELLRPDPARARPDLVLDDGDVLWQPTDDLLAAGPTDPVFVVEAEDDGRVRLRFGDDENGRSPAPELSFALTYRLGGGTAGNLPPDSITQLTAVISGVSSVRNPIPAAGGADPEPTERVRLVAPQAFQRQERAVTEDDYASVAMAVPGVQRAAARLRWTGSWYAAAVTVDRLGGGPLAADGRAEGDPGDDLAARLTAALEQRRLAGVDVELRTPEPVPVDLALALCVRPGHVATDVGRDVAARLSDQTLPDGRRGVFHPDEVRLGEPVYLSRIYAAALEVPGVATVQAKTFRRLGGPDAGELAAGVLRASAFEVVELGSDPARPERGRLLLDLAGGL